MSDFDDDLTAQATAGEEDQDQAAGETGPAPMLAGTFAIYQTPDGGYVLVTETPRGVEHKTISGRMVKLGAKVFGGMLS